MEATAVYCLGFIEYIWRYIKRMENVMETAIVYWGLNRV